MTISGVLSRLRQIITDHGVIGSVRVICGRGYRFLRPPVAATHPFDLQHGVDTSGLIPGRKLRSKQVNASHITAYWGTAPSFFSAVMERWQTTLPSGLRLQDYAFLDIGCGKGRVVMLASEFQFQQVAGVELNEQLAQTAQENLTIWKASEHACKHVQVIEGDALAYSLPEGPLLIYLFNPFDRPLMEKFVDRLVTSSMNRTQPIDVLYVFPFHAEPFLNSPAIELVWDEESQFSEEDASADVFKSRQERCQLYRILPAKHPSV